MITRRTVLQVAAATGIASGMQSQSPTRRLKTRASKDIRASPISIGFETLDRKMFDPERTYPYLAQAGVKWARCQTGWARTETRKGEYDFAWLDSVVDRLLAIGIQPWFNLGYGNKLYTPQAPDDSAVGWVPLNSSEAEAAWVRYVGEIARRYGSRVKIWELWNEPTIPNFWQPEKPSADGYMKLVNVTAPVLRKQIPDATLVGGVLTSFPALFPFLERCMELGLGDRCDKLSYHPYRARPEANYREDVETLRGVVARWKPGMSIWQGENGAPSFGHGFGALNNLEWTEQAQARWLLRRLMVDLVMKVELTSYFHTVDLANYVGFDGPNRLSNPKGVLRAGDYTPKPAFAALQNICSLFDSETKPAGFLTRIERTNTPLESLAVETAAFERNGYAMHVYWYPSDLQKPFDEARCKLTVWSGKAAKFNDPVSVDLLTGVITSLSSSAKDGLHTWDQLPLRDYPCVITDSALVA